MPRGEVGGEEEGREKDRPDQSRPRPAHRLTNHQRDQEQKRQGQSHPPEPCGDRADPGMADQEWTHGERDIADEQGDERPAVDRPSIVMLNLFQHPFLLIRPAPSRKWTLKQVQGDGVPMPSLFDPISLSPTLQLPSRILMAPLTRGRATRDGVPTDLQRNYYAQRAGAGLIISEATGISREGLGWPYAPGLWTQDQVEGWKPVVAAVHEAGGRIVAQLWHMGRLVHDNVSGMPNISASATKPPHPAHTYAGKLELPESTAASLEDIERILGDYAAAARNAIAAGFDGVQIHGANGYLIDQFLRDGTNHRTDDYGGSVDNRLRFMTSVVKAVTAEVGIDRTGIRLSPVGESQGCDDSDNHGLFTAAAARLEGLKVPWIELREPGPHSTFRATNEPPVSPAIRQVYSGKLVLNSDYDATNAQATLDAGMADAISFGRTFIANPDLPERLRSGAELNAWNAKTFYTQGPEGYTNYAKLTEQAMA